VPEHVHNQALQLLAWGHAVTVVTSRMAGAGPDPEFVRCVGTSRVIYANGGVARITTGAVVEQLVQPLLGESQ